MRRLVRLLFMLGAVLSLLAFIAVCLAWVRSYTYGDSWVQFITSPTSDHRGEMLRTHLFSSPGNFHVSRTLEGVMVRELQHGGWSGPIPRLEASRNSIWQIGKPVQVSTQ